MSSHSSKDTLDPLTACESKHYFFSEDLHPNPEIGKQFHFYHPDLGTGNIIIANNKISAIIDGEAAGFYPRFWISTKLLVSPGFDFDLSIPGVDDVEWRRRLRMKLEEQATRGSRNGFWNGESPSLDRSIFDFCYIVRCKSSKIEASFPRDLMTDLATKLSS